MGPPTLIAWLLFICALDAWSQTEINPPLGPYVNLTEADFVGSLSFSTNDAVVGTDYFYWYDVYSQAHILDPDNSDALTDHPDTMADFSYKSLAWHSLQLSNMMDAGIDFLLAVSWGAPSERDPQSQHYWSFAGLGPLVQAREKLLEQGKQPPRIAMFYDTSTLQYNTANQHLDLRTLYGREWFYESIRDFYSLIPPKHWAMIDGHPIVFLYSAAFAAGYDQTAIDYAKQTFARDFGGHTPYVVREISWQVRADNQYQWGGALGLKNPGVASLGPGYNDSAVFGRTPLVVSREGGGFFERNWIRFLQNPSKMAVVETWNEFHEGTDIADSREYGRTYIQLSRRYVDMFKQGLRPPFARGAYSDTKFVSITLQAANVENGLSQFDLADGVTTSTNIAGSDCRAVAITANPGRYIYFRVDDSFKWSSSMQLQVQVDYYDSSSGSFRVEFDGSDLSAPFQGAYSASPSVVSLTGSGTWRSALFSLSGVRFLNSQNGGADFRIAVSANQLFVRQVKVIRPGVPDEAGQVVFGFQDDFSIPDEGTNWVAIGPGDNAFERNDGFLEVRTVTNGFNYLLLDIPGGRQSTQEVLARVRIAQFAGGYSGLGGIAGAVNTNDTSGMNWYFTISSGQVKALDLYDRLLPLQPAQNFAWGTNAWYWLRLQHQTNGIAGAPDVRGKIWRADGITAEPAAWLATWDYFPQDSSRAGIAGIFAGSGPLAAELEFDYFLLKAAGLPSIQVRLPARKPARATLIPTLHLTANTMTLRLEGEPGAYYSIDASTNLADWRVWSTLTCTNGAAEVIEQDLQGQTLRFYRARLLGL